MFDKHGDTISRIVETDKQKAVFPNYMNYRYLCVSVATGTVVGNGSDVEMVTITVRDGLEVVRGADSGDATILNYDGEVKISIDGNEKVNTLTNGSVEFDLTTDKPAGSKIEIVAESLADHPAESDSATIEVMSP